MLLMNSVCQHKCFWSSMEMINLLGDKYSDWSAPSIKSKNKTGWYIQIFLRVLLNLVLQQGYQKLALKILPCIEKNLIILWVLSGLFWLLCSGRSRIKTINIKMECTSIQCMMKPCRSQCFRCQATILSIFLNFATSTTKAYQVVTAQQELEGGKGEKLISKL